MSVARATLRCVEPRVCAKAGTATTSILTGAAERVTKLRSLIADAGRKSSDVTVSVCPYLRPIGPEEIDGYAEAGVDQLVLLASIRSTDDIERVLDPLAAVMSRAL